MSSTKRAVVAVNPKRRILWLVVAHAVVGHVGAFLAYSSEGLRATLCVGAFLGVVFSQTSLLAIWGGLGRSRWWLRLICVSVIVGYLTVLLGIGIHEFDRETIFVVVSATTFVVTPLLVARFFKVAVHLDYLVVDSVVRIQFSIRQLMMLTFVVAYLITIGKWMQPFYPLEVFHLLLFAVAFAGVSVLPLWFVLATKQPYACGVATVAAGACAGYCLDQLVLRGGDHLMMTATTVEALAVVVSLLVVRTCGYRLVHQRQPARSPAGLRTFGAGLPTPPDPPTEGLPPPSC